MSQPHTTAEQTGTRPINVTARRIQDQMVAQALEAMNRGEDVLIIAPTGAGKTYIGNAIAQHRVDDGERGVMLQMRKRIALQNIDKATHSGIKPEHTALVYDGDIGAAATKPMVYALPQTLADRPGAIGRRDFVMIDEVHRAVETKDKNRDAGKELNRVLADLSDDKGAMRLVGMTASPYPSEGTRLHPRIERATRITLTYEDAISAGMITGIKTVTPDYRLKDGRWLHKEIEAKLEDRDLERSKAGLQTMIRNSRSEAFLDNVVDVIIKNDLKDKPCLGFTDRIEEAERLTEAMNRRGIKAAVIHSEMNPKEIDRAISDYESGKITKLNSVDMIGEGFDAPNTVGVVNIKALMSRREYIQINGRAQRTLAGKSDGVMIDFGASTALYGNMNEFRKVQQFTMNPDRSGFNPWITLDKEPHHIRALVTGKDVYYAIAVKPTQREKEPVYHIVRSTVDRKTELRKLEHVRPNLMTAADVRAFAVERVSANETDFLSLRTRREVRESTTGPKEYTRAALLAAAILKGQRSSLLQMSHAPAIGYAESKAMAEPVRRRLNQDRTEGRSQLSL
jgi:superfamily II DNA or RNA helicase